MRNISCISSADADLTSVLARGPGAPGCERTSTASILLGSSWRWLLCLYLCPTQPQRIAVDRKQRLRTCGRLSVSCAAPAPRPSSVTVANLKQQQLLSPRDRGSGRRSGGVEVHEPVGRTGTDAGGTGRQRRFIDSK